MLVTDTQQASEDGTCGTLGNVLETNMHMYGYVYAEVYLSHLYMLTCAIYSNIQFLM